MSALVLDVPQETGRLAVDIIARDRQIGCVLMQDRLDRVLRSHLVIGH